MSTPLKNIFRILNNSIFRERSALTVTQFYGWFKIPIQRWIQIAKCKAMSRIKKAVELDKVDETNIVSIDSDATFPNRVRVQKIKSDFGVKLSAFLLSLVQALHYLRHSKLLHRFAVIGFITMHNCTFLRDFSR